MRNKNLNLKLAILEEGLTQRDLAREIGINESLVSMAIHGKFIFDDEQKSKIAQLLNRPERELFRYASENC